jgi:hypothetical protein
MGVIYASNLSPIPSIPQIITVFYHHRIERNSRDIAGSYTLQIHLISTISSAIKVKNYYFLDFTMKPLNIVVQ